MRISESRLRFFLGSYFVVIIFLFLYSFTQVDLGLTLSRWSIWQSIQSFFQHIGYFDRILSTVFYTAILLLLAVFYIVFSRLSFDDNKQKKKVWFLLIAVVGILTFSYNAFSYDLLNYIFDAKIVTFYHQDPYIHKALDYPKDPMLGFMHWTHRVYPYGPAWLLFTVPISYVGLQLFLPTLVLFKVFIGSAFLGAVYFLVKIKKKISSDGNFFNAVVFGLHPLVIIEVLVSAHNDIVMMFFSLFGLYCLLQKKYFFAFLLLFVSIGIKFATVFLLPTFLFLAYCQLKKRRINYDLVFLFTIIIMIVPVVFSSWRTELQPWYLLWVLPFPYLMVKKQWVKNICVIVSFGLLLQYIPFLYAGNWNPPIPIIKLWIIIGSSIIAIVGGIFWTIKQARAIR